MLNRKISSEANGEGISPRRVTTRIVARRDRVEERAEAGQVEVVVEAFAIGLDDDREVGELADDLEQVLGPEPLEPERRPLRRVGPGHQQGPAGVLAEPEAEQGAVAQLVADQGLGHARRSGPSNRSSGGSSVWGRRIREAVVAVEAARP